ncbi:MAG: hypothetical protein A2836_00800 [Candidatus Taylorbacteria bacterium RIFCSPHIGHO2_01_FULL_45_63]|uniref:DUF1565 domain-containing protein n=1 Tax=Candidatus Taylorbacteria bacterium RIFCSPHIGHO2_02_FULL_45_35 TaxID=1802311 RepID=A0A1G2MTH4_9BACT|nr:MAG: hypothetical protein A2836_00800 [Candidatus Taylorbacteria bacterium RIFCSPHIGHO2_01_FULL_45_63]OHA27156.1 MAG: hypothetical protein A3D56_03500 [Candidatus Taylorbacteria bacterium RIFCSPHIGHO2_02_FULL_45_35]OHA33856.1 MAG: hypothetical protein A3A22_01475 [Candidatus Taylorbacteria bacterium RIFCSPLOWO2_01_FULL_45_34b]
MRLVSLNKLTVFISSCVVLFVFLASNQTARAAVTYYVDYVGGSDSNIGTSPSTPWKHAPGDTRATGAAGSKALLAGDTVIFKGGVKYFVAVGSQINLNWNGTSASRITYDGNSAGTWGTGRAIFTDNYANHNGVITSVFYGSGNRTGLTFKNLEFSALGGASTLPPDNGSPVIRNAAIAIRINGSANSVLVDNSVFREIGYWFSKKPMNAEAISGVGVAVLGANGLTVTNSDFSRVNIGLEMAADSSITNLTIANNAFHDSMRWPVDLYPFSSGTTIDQVNIHHNKFYDHYQFEEGFWTGYGESPHNDSIFLRIDTPCNWGTVNIYANEFWSNQNTGVGGTASIYITGGPSANIYNNTFRGTMQTRTIYVNGGTPGPLPQVVRIQNNSFIENYQWAIELARDTALLGTIDIRNNIFYDTRTGSGNNEIFRISDSSIANSLTVDYNIYQSFNTNGSWFFWAGRASGGLSTMQSFGLEAHGMKVDPQWVNSTYGVGSQANLNDLHLKSTSPAINAGANLSSFCSSLPGLCSDKDGTARPGTGAWDIGAYEDGSSGGTTQPPSGGTQTGTGTYYVATTGNDSNAGTQASPWRSTQKAASNAVAGNTVIFAPGSYPGNVTFSNSGTSGARITFSGGTLTGAYAVNGSYITFTGQTFTGYGDPVFQYEGSNGEIKNFSYHTGQARKFVNWNGNNGLVDTGDVTGLAPATSGGGVFIATGGNNITVRKVNLHDNDNTEAFGYIWGTNIKILENTMINSDNSRYDLVHADFLQVFAYSGTAASNNVEVAGNRIINSDVQAFMMNAKNTGVPTSPNIHHWYIHNNIFANSWQSASIYVPYTEIANNIFYNWGTNNGYAFSVRDGTGSGSYSVGTNVSIYNNAFVGTTYAREIAVSADYNYRDGASLPDGTHNKTGTAGFTNIGQLDFSLTSGSILRDAGRTLTSFSNDILGNGRPQGSAWDIGAYEYGGSGGVLPPPGGGTPLLPIIPETCSAPALSPWPSTFANPCPVVNVASTISQTDPITIKIAPTQSETNLMYVSTKAYMSGINAGWSPFFIAGGTWITSPGNSYYIASPFTNPIPKGSHYIATWDWTYKGKNADGSNCFVGPESNICGKGKWRIHKITVQ